jgi:LmbE family N-acetylglucosaminyl deacetylase
VREEEARAALAQLGVPPAQLYFLREPDARLPLRAPGAEALAGRIAAHLESFKPTIVFSPWLRDGHGDHIATALAVRRALARTGSRAELYEYAVWLEDFGTPQDAPRSEEAEPVDIDVREFRACKMRAIRAHRSQLGGLIVDAATSFVLPQSLLQRADRQAERFYRIVPRGVVPA